MSKFGAIPNLIYSDVNTAVSFIKTAFGFKEHKVYKNDSGNIVHAQLILGNALIMVNPFNPYTAFGKMLNLPKNLNGYNTQTPYFVIENIDAHYKNAIANGAEIIIEIKDESYGGRGYSCKDPEGNIWNFGSYNPYLE
ncbi:MULTISPECIES: VOC family protein [Aequorivita]|uniref:VOC family protein n=2 Tax=Aequorivita TaxID=153265 RepID=A0AB35YPQ2_9FLAO|nr:VOC family protein [Aequorivita sp. Ant34-E75]WGF93595.1 glyoxalase [Aequorivita sp. Ant34-E75]